MNNIINVVNYLSTLGDTNPHKTWDNLKSNETAFSLASLRDEYGNEYLTSNYVEYLKSRYQKLVTSNPNAYCVINGVEFSSENELEGYLKGMLKSLPIGSSLTDENRKFFADLLSKSSLILSDSKKYGVVIDVKVNTKVGFSGRFFEVVYANGRAQTISITKYLNPSKHKLVDIDLSTKL
jgi:hypothetical protein